MDLISGGSGGLAAVSAGISPWLLLFLLLALGVGIWKVAKIFWVMFR